MERSLLPQRLPAGPAAQSAHGAPQPAHDGLAGAVLDTLSVALCLLDADRRVRLANAAACRLFGRHGAIALRDGRLACAEPATARRLDQAVQAVCHGRLGRDALRVGDSPGAADGLQLLVSAAPQQRAQPGMPIGAPAPILALVTAARIDETCQDEVTLASLFGLTASEARLMHGLAAGDDLRRLAQAQHIAISTARSHLQSIFRKTGYASQAQLVAAARTLPAARPQRHARLQGGLGSWASGCAHCARTDP